MHRASRTRRRPAALLPRPQASSPFRARDRPHRLRLVEAVRATRGATSVTCAGTGVSTAIVTGRQATSTLRPVWVAPTTCESTATHSPCLVRSPWMPDRATPGCVGSPGGRPGRMAWSLAESAWEPHRPGAHRASHHGVDVRSNRLRRAHEFNPVLSNTSPTRFVPRPSSNSGRCRCRALSSAP